MVVDMLSSGCWSSSSAGRKISAVYGYHLFNLSTTTAYCLLHLVLTSVTGNLMSQGISLAEYIYSQFT